MAGIEYSQGSQEPPQRQKSRLLLPATVAGAIVVGSTGMCWFTLIRPYQESHEGDQPPGAITTLEPPFSPSITPSVRPSVTVFPSIKPPLPPSSAPTTSIAPPDFCDTQQGPFEGNFDKNTGVHMLSATSDRQSIAIVTPDRSSVQQLRWKLPGQGNWITFNPGENAGIVVRTSTDMQIDTGDNRAAWGKMCEETPDAAGKEIPSRVDDIFRKFFLEEVVVYTIMKDGYGVQVVPRGQSYSQGLPYEFFKF